MGPGWFQAFKRDRLKIDTYVDTAKVSEMRQLHITEIKGCVALCACMSCSCGSYESTKPYIES